jgi:hypothetical protein
MLPNLRLGPSTTNLKTSKGAFAGDDGMGLEKEGFYHASEDLPNDATASPASPGSSSVASLVPAGTSLRSSLVLAVVGGVTVISKYLPKPTAPAWSRIPDTCTAEFPESGTSEMATSPEECSVEANPTHGK